MSEQTLKIAEALIAEARRVTADEASAAAALLTATGVIIAGRIGTDAAAAVIGQALDLAAAKARGGVH